MLLPQSICVPMHRVIAFIRYQTILNASNSYFLHLTLAILIYFDRISHTHKCVRVSVYVSGALHGIEALIFVKRTPIALNGTVSSQKSLLSINAISECICILIKKIIYDAICRFNTLETFAAEFIHGRCYFFFFCIITMMMG